MTTFVNQLIQHQHPEWTGALAAYPYSNALAEQFKATTRFGDPYLLYKRMGGTILLPRAVCPEPVNDRRAPGEPVDFSVSFEPRNEEQARVIEETVQFLKEGRSGCLQAPTGFGKTAVTMPVIAHIGLTTLVVLFKEDLMKQWHGELKRFLGLADHEIGIVQADKCDVLGKKVVLAMGHSLCKPDRYPSYVYDWAGMMIIDEVHRVAAETFSEVCSLVSARLRLGLSATPERSDGKELLIFSHIGPVRVKAHLEQVVPKVIRYRSPWTVPRRIVRKGGRRVVQKIPHVAGKTGHLLKAMARDDARNRLLTELAVTAHLKQRNTVMFFDTLEHIRTMRKLLVAAGVPGKDIGDYVGGMSESELDRSKAKPIILATYAMMKEGTNIPWLDTVILCTPKSDVRQAVGRIRREYPGKKQAVVMDIRDDDSPVFKGYARSREKWYRSIGCQIVDL